MKKNKIILSTIFSLCVIGLVSFFVGCATTSGMDSESSQKTTIKKQKFDQNRYNLAAKNADFGTVIGMVQSENADEKNPKLNLNIDEGLAYHFSNEYEASADSLYNADIVLQTGLTNQVYAPSLFEAYTLIAIDALSNYNNENGYNKEERVENAMIRIRRLAEIQTMYDDYRKQIEEAQKNAEDPKGDNYLALAAASQVFDIDLVKLVSSAPPKMSEKDRYADSEFARLLSVYIRKEYGESSNKYDIQFLKTPSVIEEANAAISIPQGQGRLEVFAFNGTIAQEKVNVVNFPGTDTNGRPIAINFKVPETNDVIPMTFSFSYPGLERDSDGKVKSNSKVDKILISVKDLSENQENGTMTLQKSAILVEDFNESLRKENDYNSHSAFFKNMAGIITAKSAAATAGVLSIQAAYKALATVATNPMSKALAQIAYETAKESLKTSINDIDKKIVADTTHVKALPEKVSCAGFYLPKGNYEVKIDYMNGNSVIHTETKKASVKEGSPVLVESFYMK